MVDLVAIDSARRMAADEFKYVAYHLLNYPKGVGYPENLNYLIKKIKFYLNILEKMRDEQVGSHT